MIEKPTVNVICDRCGNEKLYQIDVNETLKTRVERINTDLRTKHGWWAIHNIHHCPNCL